MKTEKVRVHKGCGGLIRKGRCEKCGEKQVGIVKRILGEGSIIEKTGRFDGKTYRERIRERRDIP